MKKSLSIITLLIQILFITACGPVYESQYTLIPPKSDVSKMCTSQCIQTKSFCEQGCRAENDNCKLRAQQSALYEYNEYKSEQVRIGQPVSKTIRDFDRSYSCSNSCNCESTYRDCFSACGGQVIENKVCVAFCDKAR